MWVFGDLPQPEMYQRGCLMFLPTSWCFRDCLSSALLRLPSDSPTACLFSRQWILALSWNLPSTLQYKWPSCLHSQALLQPAPALGRLSALCASDFSGSFCVNARCVSFWERAKENGQTIRNDTLPWNVGSHHSETSRGHQGPEIPGGSVPFSEGEEEMGRRRDWAQLPLRPAEGGPSLALQSEEEAAIWFGES